MTIFDGYANIPIGRSAKSAERFPVVNKYLVSTVTFDEAMSVTMKKRIVSYERVT